MGIDDTDQLQRQALEMMRAQQEAYLEAIRTWTDSVTAGANIPWPDAPAADTLPNASEVAEASAAFTAKLLEEQSKFMRQLSRTLAEANRKR